MHLTNSKTYQFYSSTLDASGSRALKHEGDSSAFTGSQKDTAMIRTPPLGGCIGQIHILMYGIVHPSPQYQRSQQRPGEFSLPSLQPNNADYILGLVGAPLEAKGRGP